METAVTEILEHCKKLIAEGHQIDTQGLVHWIEDTLLDKEKQQIIDAWEDVGADGVTTAEEYYNTTFKSE